MKQKSSLFIVVFFLSLFSVRAQDVLKIGHVNIPELVQKMPESDSIQKVLNKEADEMENMYSELIGEHQKNVTKYDNEKDTYSDFVKKTKESELMEAAGKIQKFQQDATQQLQKRNMELMQPVYTKLKDAIARVATRNNFTYILDLSNGSVVFYSANSQDINPLVLAELGIEKK
ncbi:MAG TPA: OmpH family outer membrane protein [Draconibacterium sp.]|nr:OmpH family outer membrane protein [Draconibacterium sp.]